jgi:hypothetical protein
MNNFNCIQINNLENLAEINKRLYERNLPSAIVSQPLSFRGMSTKYQQFPMLDAKTPQPPQPDLANFSLSKTFFPGVNAPICGYVNCVNDESYLKNLFFANQACPQAAYVPDSSSELYNPPKLSDALNTTTHSLLFESSHLGRGSQNPCNQTLGRNLFNNSTRVQVKDIN